MTLDTHRTELIAIGEQLIDTGATSLPINLKRLGELMYRLVKVYSQLRQTADK